MGIDSVVDRFRALSEGARACDESELQGTAGDKGARQKPRRFVPAFRRAAPLYFFDLNHRYDFGTRILSLLYRHAVYIDILKGPTGVI